MINRYPSLNLYNMRKNNWKRFKYMVVLWWCVPASVKKLVYCKLFMRLQAHCVLHKRAGF